MRLPHLPLGEQDGLPASMGIRVPRGREQARDATANSEEPPRHPPRRVPGRQQLRQYGASAGADRRETKWHGDWEQDGRRRVAGHGPPHRRRGAFEVGRYNRCTTPSASTPPPNGPIHHRASERQARFQSDALFLPENSALNASVARISMVPTLVSATPSAVAISR